MTGSRPRLRPDLIVREVSDPQGGRRYQVRNPATKEQFELGEEELFLCRQTRRNRRSRRRFGRLSPSRFGLDHHRRATGGFLPANGGTRLAGDGVADSRTSSSRPELPNRRIGSSG
ncbi:MAG: hypothetical protein V9H25_14710 [Candidatus Competibacter sp.]